MQKQLLETLQDANNSAFINSDTPCEDNFRPKLILNQNPNRKILTTIEKELNTCQYFEWSVAFITQGGLKDLLIPLIGKKGRIITTNYLNFTDPYVIEKIKNNYKDIEIRVAEYCFHSKGYTFYHDGYSTSIIGSANLSAAALSSNQELNLLINSINQGSVSNEISKDFEKQWENASIVTDEFLDRYKIVWKKNKTTLLKNETTTTKEIIPNSMQIEALFSLNQVRKEGKTKAIIISATGTGKTYLCAFDIKAYKPRKFLYVVHRELIAKTSIESFKEVLGEGLDCAFYGKGSKDLTKTYQFAMEETLTKHLEDFNPEEFDYIVIDEAHRSAAPSYQKILKYFRPKFLLGMTATPERTDGVDIFSLFDNNIAYEIRLNQAMKANLLCDFHYYGISDLSLNGKTVNDDTTLRDLVSPLRAKHLKQGIDFYSIEKDKIRGLIFVSRISEASELGKELNSLGISNIALSGKDNEEDRQRAIKDLKSYKIKYIITVDIFNEGVDIPFVNQILMVRPTQSAIIFVQQLGRGLRKNPGKEFLTVIDFIGNYKNNFFIPIALYGDNSGDTGSLRKHLIDGNLGIYGNSTISFDRISKAKIFQALNNTNLNTFRFKKERYFDLKKKLNKIPTLLDFEKHDTLSPVALLRKGKSNTYNYYEIKAKFEGIEENNYSISEKHLKSLSFFTKLFIKGLREEETIIIKLLLEKDYVTFSDIKNYYNTEYLLPPPSDASINSAINILSNKFYINSERKNFGNIIYLSLVNNKIISTDSFKQLYKNKDYKNELKDLINVSEEEFKNNLQDENLYIDNDFILYRKYMRRDVLRLLNWEKNEEGTVFGYKHDKDTNTCPLFINYYKNTEKITENTDYHDNFISENEFLWESRFPRTLDSKELQPLIYQDISKVKIPLFVKKNNEEGSNFYFLGYLKKIEAKNLQKPNKNKGDVVKFKFKLLQPISYEMYNYFDTPIPKIEKEDII